MTPAAAEIDDERPKRYWDEGDWGTRIAAGQQEQVVDEPGHPIRLGGDVFDCLLAIAGRTVRSSEKAGVGPDRGEGTAQLVRGVGDEASLGHQAGLEPVTGLLEPIEHCIERGGERPHLVVAPLRRQAPGEITGPADLIGGDGEGLQRPQGAATDHPGNDRGGEQRDEGEDEKEPSKAGDLLLDHSGALARGDYCVSARGVVQATRLVSDTTRGHR